MFRSFKALMLVSAALLAMAAPQARADHRCVPHQRHCNPCWVHHRAGSWPYSLYWPYGYAGYSPYGYRPYAYTWLYPYAYGQAYPSSGWIWIDPGGDLIKREYARILQTQAVRLQLENRGIAHEQWLKEIHTTPTPQDFRERRQYEELRAALNNPPFEKIRTAEALNTIVDDLKKRAAYGVHGESIQLPAEGLGKINVTHGGFASKAAFLREFRQHWPVLLRSPEFKALSQELDRLVGYAVRQALQGQVESNTVGQIAELIGQVQWRLNELPQHDSNPSQWCEANRFVRQLHDAASALERPEARYYLTGQYAAQGETVAELVQYMADNGLQFAPAVKGQEAAYRVLHGALADYHSSIHSDRGMTPSAIAAGK